MEVAYVGERFVRRMVDKKSGSGIRESFDGTYFCRLATPSSSDVGTKTSLAVERKGTLLGEIIYPNARAFTVYPGPMLFQGRGVSLIHPNIIVQGDKSSFSFAGLKATVIFDPDHEYLARSFRLTRPDGRCVTEMVMTKPVRLKSGVWVASDSTHRVYDDKGGVTTETRVTLVAEKDGEDVASFAPKIEQGYLIDFLVNGQEVVFKKTTTDPMTLPELEGLAEKKAPQDVRLHQMIEKKTADGLRASRLNQATRIGYIICAIVLACLIAALVRLLIKKR